MSLRDLRNIFWLRKRRTLWLQVQLLDPNGAIIAEASHESRASGLLIQAAPDLDPVIGEDGPTEHPLNLIRARAQVRLR